MIDINFERAIFSIQHIYIYIVFSSLRAERVSGIAIKLDPCRNAIKCPIDSRSAGLSPFNASFNENPEKMNETGQNTERNENEFNYPSFGAANCGELVLFS